MIKSFPFVISCYYLIEDKLPSYEQASEAIGVSVSQVHRGAKAAQDVGLLSLYNEPRRLKMFDAAMAFRVLAPAVYGGLGRGIATSWAAPPLTSIIVSGDELPPVWSSADGTTRGILMTPIHDVVPSFSIKSERFYEIFSLLDALRSGRAREVKLAEEFLRERIIG